MVTVLIATGTMNAGGAETLIMEMLRHKSDNVKYILLIHYNETPVIGVYDHEIKKLGVPVLYIPSVGCIGEMKYCILFQEKVRVIGHVDIIHSHLNGVGGIIAKAAKQAGIRNRIIHCHADITFTGKAAKVFLNELKLKIFQYYVHRYGTQFWACSSSAGKRLFGDLKGILIIPNVIDVEKYINSKERKEAARSRYGTESSVVLGSVGRVAQIKNYELAIQVLALLRKQGVSAEYVCYGRVVDWEYYSSLLMLAKELDVEKQIHFMGNSERVQEDIAGFDAFLMPSISEGFGMAAIEAQAAGIPTLVSIGLPRIIDVGLGLISFLPFESEKWVNAIRESEKVVKPTKKQIINAFEQCGYNSRTMVKKIEDEYFRMVAKCRDNNGSGDHYA